MNIGFDAKKAIVNLTGIGNYSRRVIAALSKAYPADGLFLFGPRKEPKAALPVAENVSRVYPPAFGGAITYELWRNRYLRGDLRKYGIDIYHGLSNEIPTGLDKSPTRTVVTIHDLIFLTRPETFKAGMRMKLRKKTLYACRHADKIIAISRQTADDIMRFYGIGSDRIAIVYQSIDPIYFTPATAEEKAAVASRYSLPERYVLCVGTIEKRKNQELLIKALPAVDAGMHAVIVGRCTPYADELETLARQTGVAERVHFLSGVPTGDLPAIYQSAAVFCFPSVYEGFGLPIAEALASRVPVIAATGSCLEEAGGPDSIYISPDDDAALAGAVNRLCTDSALRERTVARGAEYVRRFSDEAMARGLMDVYKSVLNNPPKP